jgi:hypothetical protein
LQPFRAPPLRPAIALRQGRGLARFSHRIFSPVQIWLAAGFAAVTFGVRRTVGRR